MSWKDREKEAIERIKYLCPPEGFYVAYSGGKDSTVILDLVRRAGVPYDLHYNVTTVDPPELVDFVRTQPEVQLHHPKESMWALIIKNLMPPTRFVRYCCRALKEKGGANRVVLTGVRWEESVKRSKRAMMETCYRGPTKQFLHAIIDWKEKDVWEYIRGRNLPYCCIYTKYKYSRLGCILCPQQSAKGRQRDAHIWPQYKKAYLNTFDKMLEYRLTMGKENKDWKNAEAVYRWWLGQEETPLFPDEIFN